MLMELWPAWLLAPVCWLWLWISCRLAALSLAQFYRFLVADWHSRYDTTLRLVVYKNNGHINFSFRAQSDIVTGKIIAVASVPFPFTNIWIDSINNVFVRTNMIIIHNSICFQSKPVCNGKLLIKASRIVCVGNIPSCHAIVAQAMHLRGKTIQSWMKALQLRGVIDWGLFDVIQQQLFTQLLPQPDINGTTCNTIIQNFNV